ncbi:MAG: FtsX-like permease family protein, partial [Alphaproteobacteria bacterium]|nr:FtsX-like permease family protein [Alphaproteobacteria bacterium]
YEIQVKARSLAELDDAQEELRTVLRRHRHIAPGDPDNFSVNRQDQFLDLFHKVAGTIEGIGLFITGLSLFVGGIGIMNIMFVSVAERTREIGVRKAIGAKNRTILLQFIIEAACICLIGGMIALLIAWPATLLLKKAMPAEMSPGVVCLALFVSVLTGVLSGFFPAWRAAHMNTVDALRNE